MDSTYLPLTYQQKDSLNEWYFPNDGILHTSIIRTCDLQTMIWLKGALVKPFYSSELRIHCMKYIPMTCQYTHSPCNFQPLPKQVLAICVYDYTNWIKPLWQICRIFKDKLLPLDILKWIKTSASREVCHYSWNWFSTLWKILKRKSINIDDSGIWRAKKYTIINSNTYFSGFRVKWVKQEGNHILALNLQGCAWGTILKYSSISTNLRYF